MDQVTTRPYLMNCTTREPTGRVDRPKLEVREPATAKAVCTS